MKKIPISHYEGVHLDAFPARCDRPFCDLHSKQGLIFFISIVHVHPQQGDPTEGNGASLLQQDEPSEQHGAQVTNKISNLSPPISYVSINSS